MDSVKSPSSLRIERGPSCLIVRLSPSESGAAVVEQLVDALDSHCVNRLVVETSDFSDQLINGDIKKPATIYIDTRARAKFGKLLRLKRSFVEILLLSGKEPDMK